MNNKKGSTMTIDPGGTNGILIISEGIVNFHQFKSSNWEESLKFIVDLVRENKSDTIVYETTNYVHKRIPGALNLLKLIGGIVGLKYTFSFVREINSIAVNQVKSFKNKLFKNQEQIENLTCEPGRGKGWKYQGQRINLHQLDALIIYHLWSDKSLESKDNIKDKIIKLKKKKRLGIRQEEELIKLEKLLKEK